MLLITHIAIAMVSVLFATLLFFSPSDYKFKANYLLLGATLISGTFLVLGRGTHLVESCLMGLIYTGAVFTAIIFARKKFVRQTNDY
ncbi:MAG: hypothetical protein WD885_02100 [Candidatus Saccharimonadales bacterium]